MRQYRQCLLQRGTEEQTAWIEVRGAYEGAEVELLPSCDRWKVIKAYARTLPEVALHEIQSLNRHSLPSVEPIK